MERKIPNIWQAVWIALDAKLKRHPILLKDFSGLTELATAELFVTGLGLFEVYLNGEKLGDEVLAPFFDDYNTQVQVLAFDVTDKLKTENRLEIFLGNGWYKGRFGFIPMPNRYGSELCAIAQLEMTSKTGETAVIATDESWSCRESPVLNSGIYDGENQDYTLPAGELTPVKRVERELTTLKPRTSAPLRITQRMPVKNVIYTSKGETILDFEQNFAGWVEIACHQKGQIHLDFGEVLVDGNFYNENYGSAVGGYTVTCDGTQRTYRPYFTYFGFRYVRVTGWEGEITGREFTGCVIHSDLPRSGWFVCGDSKVNRLYENIFWSQRSNFVDVPTDCPQRSERLPWSGDAQIFAPTACFNMDCRGFYPHYLDLMRRDQLIRNGGISNYLPQDFVFAEPTAIWGDASILIPMTLYDRYGDPSVLEQCYPMMTDWADYLLRQDEEHGGHRLWNYGFQFGDWLALDGPTDHSFKGRTEDGLVATFSWYYSMKELARAASVLGRSEDEIKYQTIANSIYDAVLAEYYTPSGRLAVDTQTAYLLALRFGLYPDKERIVSALLSRLEKDCWELTSGFAAAPTICSVLADNGMEDAALRLLLDTDYPSWLYEVDAGATTIWERWNSLMPNGMVNPSGMNSFNHYSYGSVGQYLYENIAGLKSTEPGFKRIRFAPFVNGKLGWCSAEYQSASGLWKSTWKINDNGSATITLLIPDGCEAEVHLLYSDQEPFVAQAGQWEWSYQPEVDLLCKYNPGSILRELAADPEAIAVLDKLAPAVGGMIRSGDREMQASSLGALAFLPQLGLNPETVQTMMDALSELRHSTPKH